MDYQSIQRIRQQMEQARLDHQRKMQQRQQEDDQQQQQGLSDLQDYFTSEPSSTSTSTTVAPVASVGGAGVLGGSSAAPVASGTMLGSSGTAAGTLATPGSLGVTSAAGSLAAPSGAATLTGPSGVGFVGAGNVAMGGTTSAATGASIGGGAAGAGAGAGGGAGGGGAGAGLVAAWPVAVVAAVLGGMNRENNIGVTSWREQITDLGGANVRRGDIVMDDAKRILGDNMFGESVGRIFGLGGTDLTRPSEWEEVGSIMMDPLNVGEWTGLNDIRNSANDAIGGAFGGLWDGIKNIF